MSEYDQNIQAETIEDNSTQPAKAGDKATCLAFQLTISEVDMFAKLASSPAYKPHSVLRLKNIMPSCHTQIWDQRSTKTQEVSSPGKASQVAPNLLRKLRKAAFIASQREEKKCVSSMREPSLIPNCVPSREYERMKKEWPNLKEPKIHLNVARVPSA